MWELDYKESWAPKNWCFWTVVLQKTLESPLECKEIKPVNPKGNQSWIFIGRTEAEAPILWPPDMKNWLIGKTLILGKIKGGGEGDYRGWDGWMASLTQWTWVWASSGTWWWQGSLACCSPWGRKELNTTEWLNWTELTESRLAGEKTNLISYVWKSYKDIGPNKEDFIPFKQINNKYVKNWQGRGVWARGSKWWRHKTCFYSLFGPKLTYLLW